MNLLYIAKWKISSGRYYPRIWNADYKKDGYVFYFGIPRFFIRQFFETIGALIVNSFNKKKFLYLWMQVFLKLGIMLEYRRMSKCQE